VRGKPLVYLDNAATSQKPRQVIEAMSRVFEEHNANIHRGVYEFSERTTAAFEEARSKVARLVNAPSEREVIFVRNATEGVNLVAYAWGRDNLKRGDRIVTTVLEHHSDFVPWQQLAAGVGRCLGTRGAPREDAPVPLRRRHDLPGIGRDDRVERAAVEVRGGHELLRRCDRTRRGGRLPLRRRDRKDPRARARPRRL